MSPSVNGLERLTQRLAEQIVSRVIELIDVDAIVQKVDMQKVVDKVDVDGLIQRVDVAAVMERIDVDDLISRIDVNALMDKIDVAELASRIDIDALIEQTELGSIIARSTTSAVTEGLDLVRSQGVGLDDFTNRWVNRILRRKGPIPAGPPLLVGISGALPAGSATSQGGAS